MRATQLQLTAHPEQPRIDTLFRLHEEADRLLGLVQDETLKELVRLAARDLHEARRWLDSPQVSSRSHILAVSDLARDAAAGRLIIIRHALNGHGR